MCRRSMRVMDETWSGFCIFGVLLCSQALEGSWRPPHSLPSPGLLFPASYGLWVSPQPRLLHLLAKGQGKLPGLLGAGQESGPREGDVMLERLASLEYQPMRCDTAWRAGRDP